MEENKTEETKPEMKKSQMKDSMDNKPASEDSKLPGPKWLFYVLSIFIPLVGIIMGIVYMTKEHEEQKKFGKTLLILGIVFGVVLPCICWVVYFFFIAGLGVLGEGASVNYNYNYDYGY